MDLRVKEDKIGAFLAPHLKEFIFDELSEGYLQKAGVGDILKDVPIPIRKTAMTGLSTLTISQNMAFVIGCDPKFQYCENYVAYILRTFDKKFAMALINEGVEAAASRDYDFACINFRAALLIDPTSTDALYCYGRACKDSYELGEDESYIARYKAESIEAFEELTMRKPDFDMGFYFLGYGYLNLGLYIKAKLTWDEFMKLTNDDELKKEIQERLDVLDEPIEIEKGYNLVLSGKFNEGIEKLSPYKDSSFKTWWPLWYYLGVAHMEIFEKELAVEEFLQVLKLSPSNIDTMEKLVSLYTDLGDTEKVEKYTKKIEVVKLNIEKDRQQKEINDKLN
ncbi:MAG: hypothetical protein PHH48_06330 [Eubacteriales bacterium]|nr:hypothetical protein [Eubacteriales bacterium]